MTIRILVIDDEREIVDTLTRHFSLLGYEVEGTTEPEEGKAMVERENFRVVIMDIAMPSMSGIDLLRWIKNYNALIHVIMITGALTWENIIACARHGADTCIFKPFNDMTRLEVAVRNAVHNIEEWAVIFEESNRLKPAGQGSYGRRLP